MCGNIGKESIEGVEYCFAGAVDEGRKVDSQDVAPSCVFVEGLQTDCTGAGDTNVQPSEHLEVAGVCGSQLL